MPGALLTAPISVTQIALSDPVNPTIANQPHTDNGTNIHMLYEYLLNDGPGSGIDADYLDSQHGAYYLDLTNAVNPLPATNFNDTSHGNRSGAALHAVATDSVNGFLSAADKTKLDSITAGAIPYTLPAATVSTLGGIIVSTGLAVDGAGHLSVNNPIATTGQLGIMKVGTNLSVTSGVVSVNTGAFALLGAANVFTMIQTAPDFNSASSVALKENHSLVDLSKYDFSGLKIWEWDWTKDSGFEGHSLGSFAHEVYKIAPEVVTLDSNGEPATVNYVKLCLLMVAKLYAQQG